MTKNKIVQSGNKFNVYPHPVTTYSKLPVDTYSVEFSAMTGYWLEPTTPMRPSKEKMYGSSNDRLKRIVKTYGLMNRSYGVLMSGDGGMGKTMLMRAIAYQCQQKYQLPIIIVDQATSDLAGYLETLGECVIVFDEFEKVFDTNEQNEFLSLFDGLNNTKQMYIVTVNDKYSLTNHLINRTGRFHHHLEFDYPLNSEIEEYLRDNKVSEKNIAKILTAAQQRLLNYDHLRAIVFELNVVGGKFKNIINDLNIDKSLGIVSYYAELVFENKTITVNNIDISGDINTSETINENTQLYFEVKYPVSKLTPVDKYKSQFKVNGKDVKITITDYDNNTLEDTPLGELKEVRFKLPKINKLFAGI